MFKQPHFEQAKEYLSKHPYVLFAYLFGSVAQGKITPFSDIDIAIYLKNGLKESEMAQIKQEIYSRLVDILKTDCLDLVILNQASLPLAARAIQHKKLLVDKDPFLRHKYESLILRKYFDFAQKEKQIFQRRYALG